MRFAAGVALACLILAPWPAQAQHASLDEETARMLDERGFVLRASHAETMFDLYKEDQHVLLTTDLLLHAWRQAFDGATRIAEDTIIHDGALNLAKRLTEASLEQAAHCRDGQTAQLAEANAAYFAVAAKLLDPDYRPPRRVRALVDDEVAGILSGGCRGSPIMSIGVEQSVSVDYDLFRPRGHYTRTERLQGLFRAYSWWGQTSFSFAVDQPLAARRAMLMTQALYSDPRVLESYQRLDRFLGFVAGPPNNVTPAQLAELLRRDLGGPGGPDDLSASRVVGLITAAAALPPPSRELDPSRCSRFRFLGLRLSLDERLIDEVVDPKTPGRLLPSALDVAYALGADAASVARAPRPQVDGVPNVDARAGLASARALADSWGDDVWRQTIAGYWLAAIRGLYHRPPGEVQDFIKRPEWQTKLVQTGLGAWTQMRHAMVAFIDPHVIVTCVSDRDQRPEWWTYVEPYPDTYGLIGEASARYAEILAAFGAVPPAAFRGLRMLAEDAPRFAELARRGLAGERLAVADHDWVRLWPIRRKWIEEPPEGFQYLYSSTDRRMALVVDVAHELDIAGGTTLEEAIGDPAEIIARGRFDGETVDLRGAVFTHFEFGNDRGSPLTDEEWQAEAAITPPPEYARRLFVISPFQRAEMAASWLPLGVREPVGDNLRRYGYPVPDGAGSAYFTVTALRRAPPRVLPLLARIPLDARSTHPDRFMAAVIDGGAAAYAVLMNLAMSDRVQRAALWGARQFEWAIGVVERFRRTGATATRPDLANDLRELFSVLAFHDIVPEASGVYVKRPGRPDPELVWRGAPVAYALSPDRQLFAALVGGALPDPVERRSMPLPERLTVADVASGASLFEAQLPRGVADDGALQWIGDSHLLVSRWPGRLEEAWSGTEVLVDLEARRLLEPAEAMARTYVDNEGIAWRLDFRDDGGATLVRADRSALGSSSKVALPVRGRAGLVCDHGLEGFCQRVDGRGCPTAPLFAGRRAELPFAEAGPEAWSTLSPDETSVVITMDRPPRFWRYDLTADELQPLFRIDSDREQWRILAWSGDRDMLFTRRFSGRPYEQQVLWVRADGQEIRRLPTPAPIMRSLWTPLDRWGATWIAVSGGSGTERLWHNEHAPLFDPARLSEYPLLPLPPPPD